MSFQETEAESLRFLHLHSILQIPDQSAVIVTAAFNPERYHPALFEQLAIARPAQFSNMAPKRQTEFLAGRCTAALALETLGLGHPPVEIGVDRAPVWPTGTTGSISHSNDISASIVSSDPHLSCGIDTEQIASGSALEAIYRKCLSETERAFALSGCWYPAPSAATLLFSAKETIFKAFYPRVRHFFGFESAEIVTARANEGLVMRLTRSLNAELPEGMEMRIAFSILDNRVLTYLLHDRSGT